MTIQRATIAEIDLNAFKHNLGRIRSLLQPDVKVMAVVKANAYGHGAIPCAQAALEAGADWLGVAILEEGVELRTSGIDAPILVMGSIFPNEAEDLVRHDLSTSVSDYTLARELSSQAEKQGKTAGIHLKIDTGMGRLGMPPDELPGFMQQTQSLKNLHVEGIFTHLSSADEADSEFTRAQLSRLGQSIDSLKSKGIEVPMVHAANSSGILNFPASHLDMVRPGIFLYGTLGLGEISSSQNQKASPDVSKPPPRRVVPGVSKLALRKEPVMQWKTKILQIRNLPKGASLSYNRQFTTDRDSLIAVLPVGYADGLNRRLSNNMDVLVKGQRAPQVGTICMDLCLIDVTDIEGVRPEDEVVLFGKQGNEMITVDEMAERCGTISYEILCNVGKRVPRVYLP
ncbi:Alanine racemase [hydrothermal vent metagenome]|uniref:Alanine racemase n=1 Tax=hydrothermal vent metagenome TaxID=652676 RepID=A0A3B1CW72_9ZZZZ